MRRALAPAVAVLAIAAGGCGSGTEDEGPLTKAQLAKRAGAVCDRGESDLKDVRSPATDAQSVPFLQEVKKIFDSAASDMRALEPPARLGADWDDFIAIYEAGSRRLERMIRRVERGDRDVLRGFASRFTVLSRRENTLARRLGIKGCLG